MSTQTARAHLSLVTAPADSRTAEVSFCSHCGSQPEPSTDSRVCDDCGLGVLLQADAAVAPRNGEAFIVIDNSLSVCAVSSTAEQLLATRETDAVNRHVTELLVPADAEAQTGTNLATAVTWAARGDEQPRTVNVRPANTFGMHLRARIAACGPPRAALVVFE